MGVISVHPFKKHYTRILLDENADAAAKELALPQLQDNHPSALIRGEFMSMHLAKAVRQRGVSKEAFERYRLGEEALENMQVLSTMAEPEIAKRILTLVSTDPH
jgi:hypothetical protein